MLVHYLEGLTPALLSAIARPPGSAPDRHALVRCVWSEKVRRLLARNDHLVRLTRREGQVLSLMAEAYRNQQIAEALGIKRKTVKNYVTRILEALGVSSRGEAIALYRQDPDLYDVALGPADEADRVE